MKNYLDSNDILTFKIGQNIDIVDYDYVEPDELNVDLCPVRYSYESDTIRTIIKSQPPYSQITKIEKLKNFNRLYEVYFKAYDYEENTVKDYVYTTGKGGFLPVLLVIEPEDDSYSYQFLPVSFEVTDISENSISIRFWDYYYPDED